jgi:predicted helicase
MYVRFWRWASDRLGSDGVIAFVTNRNFIEKLAFDGFRLSAQDEFAEIWLMDLGGDVRANPKLSGTTHNVFGIQTGVTIAFMVKRQDVCATVVNYARRPEDERAVDKLSFLSTSSIAQVRFEEVKPDAKGNWLQQGRDEWGGLLPVADPTKGAELKTQKVQLSAAEHAEGGQGEVVQAIFRLASNGVTTQRDEWVWDWTQKSLVEKVTHLVASYEDGQRRGSAPEDIPIKWDEDLERHFSDGIKLTFDERQVQRSGYRPFTPKWLYVDPILNGRLYRLSAMYRDGEHNPSIAFRSVASEDELTVLASGYLVDAGYVKTGNGRTFELSRYRYTKSGERIDNITDWALNKFVAHYGKKGVTKDAIFHYVYAVLHDPVYRETYALNLKREFPRVPFYPDFARWAAWGETLMAMHIGYEAVEPWPVERIDTPNPKRAEDTHPRPILKSVPEQGLVRVDEDTQIAGIPREAWDYRLGNRSAIDWVLDQHKEKTPRDPTIREKFNTYRFADYKESMIALLTRVIRVSIDTVAITEAMKAVSREALPVAPPR